MRIFAFIAAGLAAIAAPSSAVTIANVPSGTVIAPFGPRPGSTPTYGQVFVSPVSARLASFTFWLTGNVGQVRGVVGTWNVGNPALGANGGYNYAGCSPLPADAPTTVCGSPTTLYDSGLIDVAAAGAVTFLPNLQIVDQTKYVLYISVFGNNAAAGSTQLLLGTTPVGSAADDAFRYFVFDDSDNDPRGNTAWNYDTDHGDALISVSVVPEPAAWAFMIAGFGLAGAVARRRRSGLALAA